MITVSIIQMRIEPGAPETNIQRAGLWIVRAARQGAQVVLLPEMWPCGLSPAAIAETARQQDSIRARLAAWAKEHSIWLIGSMPERDRDGRLYNTATVFDPGGRPVAAYRKIHLFAPLGEQAHLSSGHAPACIDHPAGTAGLAICYDLRFPELFRAYALAGSLWIFIPAAFPAERIEHWQILLRARAIENQLFIVAANQVGSEPLQGRQTCFGGRSAIIDPSGNVLCEGSADQEELLGAQVQPAQARTLRSERPLLEDRQPAAYQWPRKYRSLGRCLEDEETLP